MDDSIAELLLQRPTPEQVKLLEREIARRPQAMIPAQTFTGFGMVTRVILIPAGTVLTGKKHLKGQHNILISGTIAVSTQDGIRELTGPEVIVSPPGTKRVARTITDVIWSTTLICDKTEIADIEAEIIDPTDELPIINLESQLCLG